MKPSSIQRAGFHAAAVTAQSRSNDPDFAPTWNKLSFRWVDNRRLNQTPAQIERRQEILSRLDGVFRKGKWGPENADGQHFSVGEYLSKANGPAAAASGQQDSAGANVYTVYHVTKSMDAAKKILQQGFTSMDYADKWFGAGYYFSTNLEYVCDTYANGACDAHGNFTVIMARVVIGAPFPVLEDPDDAMNLSGQAVMPKYDAHVVLVDKGDHRPMLWPEEDKKAREKRTTDTEIDAVRFVGGVPYTEIIVFNPQNILPVAVLTMGSG